jgi:hypothetical protein
MASLKVKSNTSKIQLHNTHPDPRIVAYVRKLEELEDAKRDLALKKNRVTTLSAVLQFSYWLERNIRSGRLGLSDGAAGQIAIHVRDHVAGSNHPEQAIAGLGNFLKKSPYLKGRITEDERTRTRIVAYVSKNLVGIA